MSEGQNTYRVTLITVAATIVVAAITGAFAFQTSAKQTEAARVSVCHAEVAKREDVLRLKGDAFLSGIAEAYIRIEAEKQISTTELRAPMTRAAFALAAYADTELAQHSLATTQAFDDLLSAIKSKKATEVDYEKFRAAIRAWQPVYQRQIEVLQSTRRRCR